MDEAAGAAMWVHDAVVHAYWVEPGRLLAGEYPGHADPHVAQQRLAPLLDAGVRTFVDLTSVGETPDYTAPLAELARAHGVDVAHHRHPIPDFGTVADAAYDAILATIRAGTERGVVYVHCWGGVGRTGTVVGCHLIAGGLGFDDTVAALRSLRAGSRKADRVSPEGPAQLDVLRRRAAP